MKKIIYAITKIGKKENTKITGAGYITDEDILVACASSKGKPYIRVFENALKCCYKIVGTENEFKGAYSELVEMEFADEHGAKSTREVEIDYFIWFKLVD